MYFMFFKSTVPWNLSLQPHYHLSSHLFFQQDNKKTLKRTRKFLVDGVELSVTTSKIIGDDEKKDEEMRFLRQVHIAAFFHLILHLGWVNRLF